MRPTEAAAAGETVTSTVPEMDQDNLTSENSDDESESNEESAFDEQKVQEIFDDYMVSLPLDQCRMLGVILMESFMSRQKMKVKDAAQEAGSVAVFNEKTQECLFSNEGHLTLSRQGKYERHCVYHDKDVNRKVRVGERERFQKRRT